MVFCAIFGCSTWSHRKQRKLERIVKDLRFFKIPTVRHRECEKTRKLSTKRRALWVSRIRRKDLDGENLDKYKVCSRHFISGSPAQLFDDCNPDWALSLHLGYGSSPL
ncbi:uncharacterized protein LOC135395171 [Ornithodoros turicata]|uniref:uncharacterized protein LOC135395171 n=1 Tax=Ornithodoros turicata TaxID=34597 RepID=UPI0031392B6D